MNFLQGSICYVFPKLIEDKYCELNENKIEFWLNCYKFGGNMFDHINNSLPWYLCCGNRGTDSIFDKYVNELFPYIFDLKDIRTSIIQNDKDFYADNNLFTFEEETKDEKLMNIDIHSIIKDFFNKKGINWNDINEIVIGDDEDKFKDFLNKFEICYNDDDGDDIINIVKSICVENIYNTMKGNNMDFTKFLLLHYRRTYKESIGNFLYDEGKGITNNNLVFYDFSSNYIHMNNMTPYNPTIKSKNEDGSINVIKQDDNPIFINSYNINGTNYCTFPTITKYFNFDKYWKQFGKFDNLNCSNLVCITKDNNYIYDQGHFLSPFEFSNIYNNEKYLITNTLKNDKNLKLFKKLIIFNNNLGKYTYIYEKKVFKKTNFKTYKKGKDNINICFKI